MLTAIIAQALPEVIQLIKDRRAAADPTLPPLTDAEVIAALHAWVTETVAKDDSILKAHGQ